MRIAGVEVGKVTKIERAHEGGERPRVVTMRIDKTRAGRSTRDAHGQDPPAHLPRGQLLRRRPARLAVGARSSTTATRSRSTRPRRRCSSTRSSPRCSPTRARTSRRCCASYAAGLEGQGRARASTARSRTGSPPTATRAIVADAPLGEKPSTTSPATSTAPARRPSALDRNREQLKALVTDFNTTAGAFAARDRQPRGRDRRAAAHAARRACRRCGALNALVPGRCARLTRDLRPGVALLGPGDRRRACRFVTQLRGLVSEPELRGLIADLRPTVPGARPRSTSATRAALRAGPRGVELPERGRSCPGPRTRSRTRRSRPRARSTRRRRSRSPASPARAARATPTASGSACCVAGGTNFAYPLGTGQLFVTTAQPLLGVNPPKPRATRPPLRRRRAVRDPAAARPAHDPATRRRSGRSTRSPSRSRRR